MRSRRESLEPSDGVFSSVTTMSGVGVDIVTVELAMASAASASAVSGVIREGSSGAVLAEVLLPFEGTEAGLGRFVNGVDGMMGTHSREEIFGS